MPNLKSAKKELRKSKKNAANNKKIKNNIKALVKKCQKAIDGGNKKTAEDLLKQSLKAMDKAVQKGIMKKNTRDRKKSRIHRAFNKTQK